MVGPLLIAWLVGSASADAPCEALDEQLEWAQDEVLLEVDAGRAREALRAAEAALRCGLPAKGPSIARMFLIEAATATLEGDLGGANDAFAAAHRTDPDTWIDALGPKMREQYEAAAAVQPATGTVDLQVPTWETWLDGKPSSFPATVDAGLHVVQVHDGQEVAFGRVLWVAPGEEQLIDITLPEHTLEPEPRDPEPEHTSTARSVQLSAGLGASAAFGQALEGSRADGAALAEPATKLTVPIELGVVIGLGDLWIRPSLGLAPMLGGRFLWAGKDGAVSSLAAGLADLTVAADLGAVHAGGIVGIAYPGRIGVRGMVGLPLGEGPLLAEARAGVHVATAGRIEPAVGLLLSARVP